jgi:hypothetical protein
MVFMVFLLRLLNRTDNIAAHLSAPSPMPKIDFNLAAGTQPQPSASRVRWTRETRQPGMTSAPTSEKKPRHRAGAEFQEKVTHT